MKCPIYPQKTIFEVFMMIYGVCDYLSGHFSDHCLKFTNLHELQNLLIKSWNSLQKYWINKILSHHCCTCIEFEGHPETYGVWVQQLFYVSDLFQNFYFQLYLLVCMNEKKMHNMDSMHKCYAYSLYVSKFSGNKIAHIRIFKLLALQLYFIFQFLNNVHILILNRHAHSIQFMHHLVRLIYF